jgi:hypothetical protein
MRRSTSVLLGAVLMGIVLLPSAATAKGSTLHFADGEYAPGDLAVAHTTAETWPGAGNEPDGGPYWVYLVRGTQPLWYAHLPRDAVRVGKLRVGALLEDDSTSQTYRVRVAFEVPRVENGRYAVWVCRAACGANSGFGDLVYGHIVVGRTGQPHEDASGEPIAVAASRPQRPTERSGLPWSVVVSVVLASSALAGAWRHWRSRRSQ